MLQNLIRESEPKLLPESDVIDITQYINSIKNYFWIIFSVTIFLTSLSIFIVLSITPKYTSNVSLLIEVDNSNFSPVEELFGLDSNRKEYFKTQYEILKSRQIAKKVVKRLSLHENKHFNLELQMAEQSTFKRYFYEIKEESKKHFLAFFGHKATALINNQNEIERIDYATTILMDSLWIEPIDDTQVVKIVVETPDSILSSKLANTIADIYIKSYLEGKMEMTEKATEWLNSSIQKLRDRLALAEQRLENFDESNQVVNIDGVVGLTSEHIQQLDSELFNAQIRFQREKTLYDLIISYEASIDKISTLPEIIDHPAIQNIKSKEIAARTNVSELQQVFGPKHPKMIAAEAELDTIVISLNAQIRDLVSSITSEYKATEQKLQALDNSLINAKNELRRLSSIENQRRSLERDVLTNQQLYDSFLTRLNETDQVSGFESANARVLDPAMPATSPSSPRKGIAILGSLILSLSFCTLIAVLYDLFKSVVVSADDVERKLLQRMLGMIPKVKKLNCASYYIESNDHKFNEAVRTIRTNLQLSNIEEEEKCILIASSIPGEGKSTVSVSLALALGQLGNTLLIDTDLRRPSIGKLFSLPGFHPGVTNIVSGSHKTDECIISKNELNLDVLPAGSFLSNPQELLASKKFSHLMCELKRKYKFIVVDSAPMHAVSDAIIVSKYCNSMIGVVKYESTKIKTVKKMLSRLMEGGNRVDGIVVNNVDIKKESRTEEYSGYYDRYDYTSDSHEKDIS